MTDLTLQPRLAAKRRSRSRSRPSASCPSSVPVCVSSSSLSSSLSSFSPSSSRSSSSSSSLSTDVTPSKAANPRAPSHCCDAKEKPDHVVPALPTSAAAAAASAVVVSSSSAVATRPAATNTTTITNSITTNSITNTITTPTTPSAITTPTTITTNTTITTTTPTITTITITTPTTTTATTTTTTTRTSSSTTTTAAAAPASSPSASPSSTAAVPCTRTPAAAAAAAAAHCRAPRLQQPSSLPSPRPRPLRSQPESLPQQAPSLARPSLLPPRSISFDLPRIPPPAARPPLPPPRRRLSSRRTTDPAAGAGPSSFSADRLSSLASFVSEKTHHFARRASVTLSASSVAAVLATTTSSDQFLHDHPHDHHHHHHHHRNRNIRLAPSSSSPPTPQSHNSLHSTVANERRALVKTTPSTSLTSRPASFLSKRALPSPPPPLAFPPTTPDAISLRKLKKSASTESLLDSEGRSVKTRGKEYTPRTTTSSFSTKNSAGLTSASNKMHQTSSRLLRMTDEDRPFTRDFKDLFSTLIVSLPLSTHRFRFKTYPFSFASEEAINNLGSLKFSQSNRMPDPKDPSRIVTTTTTTTFSMAKEMARSVCQRFMDARFIELADGKTTSAFPLKGCLWQLTPKGIHILERFCQRNGIQQEHVLRLLNSTFNTMRLVILERDPKTDKLSHDKFTTEVIFRRFAGQAPNIKANISISDNDSVSDYQDGQTGVKLAESRKIFDRVIKMSFTGKCAVDWLLDCCTTVERAETYEICTLFVQFGLIQSKLEDRVYVQQSPASKDFQPTKNAIYVVTDKGKRVAGWIEGGRVSPSERNGEAIANGHTGRGTSSIRNRDDRCYTDQRETNTTRLQSILSDPALRLLYREFLRETVCEENLTFYLDVTEFNKNFHAIDLTKPDAVRETLAAAYGLYNAFLAPGSPCELNIDHPLRQDMASRMTRAVAKDDASMYTSLKEVAALFERAQQQVFKLMAGDSVPKFIRTHKYLEVAGDILDDERIAAGHGLHRSASRSARFHNGDGSR